MTKKGLGRGLGALIPEVEPAPSEKAGVQEIEVNRIVPNPKQPRKAFDQEKLQELAQSIRENGVVQPLVLRDKAGQYEIVAGERRWRASQVAGLATVPAIVREYTDTEVMEIALIENIQRQDLNPVEEAEAYHVLLEEYNVTQDELARRLGKSRPQITNTLRLLSLPDDLRQLVGEGQLSVGHAKVLLGIDNHQAQKHLASRVLKEGLSVRQLEEAIKQVPASEPEQAAPKPKAVRDADILDVEDRLRQLLGTPVKIQPGAPKGRIEINFFGVEDLTRIVDILTKGIHSEPLRKPGSFHI